MRIIVADTSPLHYLVLIGAIQILPQLFDQVFIPDAVYDELLDAGAPDEVRGWSASPPSWLIVQPAPFNDDADLRSLHKGERAAIALAAALRPNLILIDDRPGVTVARQRGFALTGTLGVLALAAQHHLIDLEPAFAALQSTNFHATPDLYDLLLARDRERRAR